MSVISLNASVGRQGVNTLSVNHVPLLYIKIYEKFEMKISIGRNGKFEYRKMGNRAGDREGGNGGKAFTEKSTN